MGHIHLGVLPKSKKWKDVVALLAGGAADGDVIAASAIAAEKDLSQAADDPVFVEAVRLMLSIPHAARSESFVAQLRDLGLSVGTHPDSLEIIAATSERLDDVARHSGRSSDFGELASRALISTLGTAINDGLPGLLATTPDDVRLADRSLSSPQGISELARSFFGRLLSDCLASWLDRTLSTAIGREERFSRASDRSAFDVALLQYSREATRIIQEFAPGWFGKRVHQDGKITSAKAAEFGAVAFKKIGEELRRKRGLDG